MGGSGDRDSWGYIGTGGQREGETGGMGGQVGGRWEDRWGVQVKGTGGGTGGQRDMGTRGQAGGYCPHPPTYIQHPQLTHTQVLDCKAKLLKYINHKYNT